jgi:hypothetical protein
VGRTAGYTLLAEKKLNYERITNPTSDNIYTTMQKELERIH